MDSNAILRYLLQSHDHERILKILESASKHEAKIWMSAINRGEVLYNLAKRMGTSEALVALKSLAQVIDFASVDEETADAAAVIKHHYKLSYGDCFAAELAIRLDATLVTADPEFEKLGNKLKVLKLQRHNE